jgi:hypothetical protein
MPVVVVSEEVALYFGVRITGFAIKQIRETALHVEDATLLRKRPVFDR